jgi:hypothetical protein
MNAPLTALAVRERDSDLPERFCAVRATTEALAAPLSAEDCAIQSMPDASPVKWHLAHTSWFFETFVLAPHLPGYKPKDPAYRMLFNSYYNAVGDKHPRPQRGLLSRPSLDAVRAYRARVDESVTRLLGNGSVSPTLASIVELGLNHRGSLPRGRFLPPPTDIGTRAPLRQLYGDVWEWTQSAYAPYPGFRPAAGAIGEYNGKFMCNQYVLRGGSCATPRSHIRASYRNFFPASARWQLSGFRLARDL